MNDKRVKYTLIFNSGMFYGAAQQLAKMTTPVAYFLGGQKDIAQVNVSAHCPTEYHC
jgi:hypothetical protein